MRGCSDAGLEENIVSGMESENGAVGKETFAWEERETCGAVGERENGVCVQEMGKAFSLERCPGDAAGGRAYGSVSS